MGKPPCCEKNEVKKGPWSTEEDNILVDYIRKHGHGRWRTLPKDAGLKRCGKSCRLRWTNYLRPDIKRGRFSDEEEDAILQLHSVLGNKWSAIAAHLPGRTDNEIKNFWNTHLKKKLLRMGIDPVTHVPRLDLLDLHSLLSLCDYYQAQSLDIANIPITNFHQNHTLPSVPAPPHDSKMGNYTSFAHFHEESRFDMSSLTQLGNNVAVGFPSFCQRPADYANEINASQMNFNGCEIVRNYYGIRSSLLSPMSGSTLTLTSSSANTARVGSSNIGDAEIMESYRHRSSVSYDSGNGFHVSGLMKSPCFKA